MKRIEKLAKEYADPEFMGPYEGYGVDAPEAFMAGFRAAREMADQRLQRLMDFLSPMDEDGDFIRPIQHAQFDLRMLGEDEVPDGA